MKTLPWIALLTLAAPLGCDQTDPVAPELQDHSVANAIARTEAVTLQGGQYDPYAADRNENGTVCGATLEGPYIDDVRPPRKIKVKPKPNPNPNEPFLLFGCMSPAYPVAVSLGGL